MATVAGVGSEEEAVVTGRRRGLAVATEAQPVEACSGALEGTQVPLQALPEAAALLLEVPCAR